MEELKARFDELHLQLLRNHYNIHNETITLKQKEETGCLIGRLQTIGSFLIDNYDDAETNEELIFIIDEYMNKPSDNNRLNTFKLDTYKQYKYLHNNYKHFIKEFDKMIQKPTPLLLSRIKETIDKNIEKINETRKGINIKLQLFKKQAQYAEYTNKIDLYVDKISQIFTEYTKRIVSNNNIERLKQSENNRPRANVRQGQNTRGQNTRGQNTQKNVRQGPNTKGQNIQRQNIQRQNTRANVRPKPPKKSGVNPAYVKQASLKQTNVKPLTLKVSNTQVLGKQVVGSELPAQPNKKKTLTIKELLFKLRDYSYSKLVEIQSKQYPKSKIKSIYDKLVSIHFNIINNRKYIESVDTPLHKEYIAILEEIEFNMTQIQRLL